MKEEMIGQLIKDLDVNYINTNKDILSRFIDNYMSIASDYSNRSKDDEKLIPYIYNAVKSAYLRRGNEELKSGNEGGISSNYLDIEEKLKKDVLAIRKGYF